MKNVLSSYLDKFVIMFIYDIFIYCENENEHAKHLEIGLKLLREH